MHRLSYRGSWDAPRPLRRSAIAWQTPDRGRRLAGDAVDAVCQKNRVIVHRRQAASYQTTCKPLKKRGFVGADRAAFRLSAKRTVHPTHMQWLNTAFADKSAPTEFAARQRCVEDVVAPPTEVALFHNLMMCLMSQASIRTASPATGPRHESCHANPAGRCSPG